MASDGSLHGWLGAYVFLNESTQPDAEVCDIGGAVNAMSGDKAMGDLCVEYSSDRSET